MGEDIIRDNSIIEYMILLSFLLICTYYDLRYKKVNVCICVIWVCIGSIFEFLFLSRGIWSYIISLSVGLLLYGISVVTKEEIGKGDAIIFCVIGIYMGLVKTGIILIFSLILVFLIGSILLLTKKANRRTRLAFAPFVTGAFTIFILL